MNEQPKKRFYKRWWFAFIFGIVVGILLVFMTVLVFAFWNRIMTIPAIRDARNAAVSATQKTVSLSNCVASPSSISFTASDYSLAQNGYVAQFTLINLDNEPRQIGMVGVVGSYTLQSNATAPDEVNAGLGNGTETDILTCDGKNSLTISNLSEGQIEAARAGR